VLLVRASRLVCLGIFAAKRALESAGISSGLFVLTEEAAVELLSDGRTDDGRTDGLTD
jgi:hypothetical protein